MTETKNMLVHVSVNIHQQKIWMRIKIAAIYVCKIWSQDVLQAYLQSDGSLTRDVYVKPKQRLMLLPDQYLKLLKPLNGLTHSDDYWHETWKQHLISYFKMQ